MSWRRTSLRKLPGPWLIKMVLALGLVGVVVHRVHASLTGVQGGVIAPPDYQLQVAVCNAVRGNVKSCNNLLSGGTYVKGFKIVSTAANACAALYDATAIPSVDTTDPVDENCEPTAYNGVLQLWSAPIRFVNGVSVAVLGGNDTTVFVYY